MRVTVDRFSVDRSSPVPLEVQLTRQVARLVAAGAIDVDDRLPSIRELADHLGINLQTVRAAYQRLESRGIVESRRGIGTTVVSDDVARLGPGRSASRSYTVGVVLPAFAHFYRPMYEAMVDALAGDPSQVLLSSCHEDPDEAARHLRQFVALGVDGILVVSQRLDPDVVADTDDLPPLVFCDWPGAPGPSVEFGLEAIRPTVDHLADHGHERIAFVAPGPGFPNMAALRTAFTDAMGSRGLATTDDLSIEVADFSHDSGARAMRRLLETPSAPTAVFFGGEDMAVAAVRAANDLGHHVPDDLAVIAYGETPMAELVTPRMTTVALDASTMGREAVLALRRLIAGDGPSEGPVSLPSSLVVRQSCGRH